MRTRRAFLRSATLSIALGAHFVSANGQNRSKNRLLPMPLDLSAVANAAAREGKPLVLMVSLPGCPWCELLRRNYLAPLRAEGLHAYEFMTNDRSSAIRDFHAKSTTPDQLARRWNITITPTLLFLNAQGQEVAPRIEGVTSAEFIGAVLDERIATARERIKAGG